ncbi:hypothetical protein GGR51DRAFT_564409 [Nemania sp. FL0031]|nr:hypothetical protein GGR51DRAFT_564409 [Nemania sp. FL0031]
MLFVSVIASLLALAGAAPTLDNSRIVARDSNGTLVETSIIPVGDVGCWDDELPTDDTNAAKGKFVEWGEDHRIDGGGWHGEEYGHAAVWICNCKHFKKDHAIPAELDEAQRIIVDICGLESSGWVWSHKWQKSFNFGTAERLKIHEYSTTRCPSNCLWNNDQREGGQE